MILINCVTKSSRKPEFLLPVGNRRQNLSAVTKTSEESKAIQSTLCLDRQQNHSSKYYEQMPRVQLIFATVENKYAYLWKYYLHFETQELTVLKTRT